MDDDFNTPEAMAVLFELATEANRSKSAEAAGQLKALGQLIGLLEDDPKGFLQGGYVLNIEGNQYHSTFSDVDLIIGHSSKNIDALIRQRADAKKAKNFAEADRIRKELADQGIILEDGPQGTTWRRL